MIILFSKHALRRMLERSVSKKVAADVISKPDRLVKEEEECKAVKKVGNKIIIVVYKNYNSIPFVITVISSSKLDKYLAKIY